MLKHLLLLTAIAATLPLAAEAAPAKKKPAKAPAVPHEVTPPPMAPALMDISAAKRLCWAKVEKQLESKGKAHFEPTEPVKEDRIKVRGVAHIGSIQGEPYRYECVLSEDASFVSSVTLRSRTEEEAATTDATVAPIVEGSPAADSVPPPETAPAPESAPVPEAPPASPQAVPL